MKKYSREDQQIMALWSLDCAERVLHFFENLRPEDNRPRKALEIGREWVETGIFRMSVIRSASLNAHAAAKEVDPRSPACFAAHAAGQAVATAHVPQHAYGGAYYSLKAIAAAYPEDTYAKVIKEKEWQSQQLVEHLQEEILKRFVVEERKNGIYITIQKDSDF